MTRPPKKIAVRFEAVDIVFGNAPERALPLIDEGKTRDEIRETTGQTVGVAGASLEVYMGEVVVLMGLSGSGKSTLLRAVNGLNKVARGSVHVSDEMGSNSVNPHTCSAARLRKLRLQQVAMVFQQFGLLPWRTVAENVGFGPELEGKNQAEIDERIKEQLELVGLSEWADKRVQELSGGMQQRVGLARAFATHAPILLMDEPYSALDPLIRARLQDELLDLQNRMKRTIIFVSHDLDEAIKIGNRIAIMEGGRIIQVGTPLEILSSPANQYVADFVAHMNPMLVYCARDAMSPLAADPNGTCPEVACHHPLRDIMKLVKECKSGRVLVRENGKIVGQITASDINRLLA